MKLKVIIEIRDGTYNDGETHDRAAHILRAVADRIEAGAWGLNIDNIDGNTTVDYLDSE